MATGKEELGGSGDSFEEAAASVSVAERPSTATPPASEKQAEEDGRPAPSIQIAELVDDDVSAFVGKLSFWPLAKFAHPAWALTDEQAEILGPELKPHLREWVNSVLPPSWNEYMAKNKPFARLIFAYVAMLLIKRAEVKHAKRIENADALIARAKEEEGRTAPPSPTSINKEKSASPAFEFVLPKKPEETPA